MPFVVVSGMVLGIHIRSLCLACISKSLNRHVLNIVSRRGTCFWDGWPCVKKSEQCEKDGKAYIKSDTVTSWSQNVDKKCYYGGLIPSMHPSMTPDFSYLLSCAMHS